MTYGVLGSRLLTGSFRAHHLDEAVGVAEGAAQQLLEHQPVPLCVRTGSEHARLSQLRGE
eukprot:scaffold27377_cov61-Phaeocystis_antarctica.AAC.3